MSPGLAEGIVCSILQVTTGDVERAGRSEDPCGTPLQQRPPAGLHVTGHNPRSLAIQPVLNQPHCSSSPYIDSLSMKSC